MDPLDFINDMLMQDQDMEDGSTCMQEDGDVSYQAILCSFYDIVGEHPPPKSSDVSSTDLVHSPHQIVNKQQDMHYKGFNMWTHQMLNSGALRVTLPANGNLQSSFFLKERAADTSPEVAPHFICPNSANFSALSMQDYHAAIKFNDGDQLMDIKVSCWEKDKALNKLLRSCSGRQSNAHFQLPSPYKEFSLKLAGVELSFEDLKLHDCYEALYVAERGILVGTPKYGSKAKSLSMAGKSGKKRTPYAQEYVDFKDLIVSCAQAVAVGNAKDANELLHRIRQVHGASADGNGSQRAAHYFSEALVARMRGTGGDYFRALLQKKPSAVTILKSFKLQCLELTPFTNIMLYFANQIILKSAKQASRLHVLEYGFDYGIQWPFLIHALADQKGGPPLLVITGIGSPQPGNNPAERLEESGRRLAAYARTYNVPFQFHAIPCSKWEDLDSSSFHIHEDDILVVNCINSLRRLADEESVDMISPRQKLFTSIHSLKPHLLITADVSAAYNSPFFVSRFREALNYYSSLFDMQDTLSDDSPERLLQEKIFYYSGILNIVACEGAERVERAETYKQWEFRIKRAGFEQLLIPRAILSRSRSHVQQHYHEDFFVHDDAANKWMLLGWKGRTSVAISAWKLSSINV